MSSETMNSLKLMILMSLLTVVSCCGYGYNAKTMSDNIANYRQEVNKEYYLTTGRQTFFSKIPFGKIIRSFCGKAPDVKQCDEVMLEIMAKELYDIYENEDLDALMETMHKFDAKLGGWFKERTQKFKQDEEFLLTDVLGAECVAVVKQRNKLFPVDSDLRSQLSVPVNVTRGFILNFMLRVLSVAVENGDAVGDKKALCDEAVKNEVFDRLFLQYQGVWMGQSYQGWTKLAVFLEKALKDRKYNCYKPLITKDKLSRREVTEQEEKTFKSCHESPPVLGITGTFTDTNVVKFRFGGVGEILDYSFTDLWGQHCIQKLRRLFNFVSFTKLIKDIPPEEDKDRMKNFLNLLFYSTRGYFTGEDSYETKALMCDYGMFQFILTAYKSLQQYMNKGTPRHYNLRFEDTPSNPYSALIESLCYGNQGYYCFFELSSDINPTALRGQEVSDEKFKQFKTHYLTYIQGRLTEFTDYLKTLTTWKLRDFIPEKCLKLLTDKFPYFDMNVNLKTRYIKPGFPNLGFISLILIHGVMRHYYYDKKVSNVIEMNNRFCEELLKTDVFLLLKVSFTFSDERKTTEALAPMYQLLARKVCSDASCETCLHDLFNPTKISAKEIEFSTFKRFKFCYPKGKTTFTTFRETLEKKEDISEYLPNTCIKVLGDSGLRFEIFKRFNFWDDSIDTFYLQKLLKWAISVVLYFFNQNPDYPLTDYICETVMLHLVKISNFALPKLSQQGSQNNETNGLAIVLKSVCGGNNYCEPYYKKISYLDSEKMQGLSSEEYQIFINCKSETEKAIEKFEDFIEKLDDWSKCLINGAELIFQGYPQLNQVVKPPGEGLNSDFTLSVDYYVMGYQAICFYFNNRQISQKEKSQTAQLLHKSRFAARLLRVLPSIDVTFSGSDIV